MREALSGTSSQCFTVSPALISIFGGCGWLVLVVFLGFLLFVLFCFLLVLASLTSEIF